MAENKKNTEKKTDTAKKKTTKAETDAKKKVTSKNNTAKQTDTAKPKDKPANRDIVTKSEDNANKSLATKSEDKPAKKGRGGYRHSPIIGNNGDQFINEMERREFTSKTIACLRELWKMPAVKNTDEAIERFDWFLQWCVEKQFKPTKESMSLAFGVDRSTVWSWETGEVKTFDPYIIKKMVEILASFDAASVLDGKQNPVAYIFRSKNYYGMKDQKDVTLAPANGLGEDVDRKQLEDKYSETVIDTTADDE